MQASRLPPVLVISIVGALVGATPARAATIRYVSPTGSDVGDCSMNPCKTIGYAIGQSVSDDVINIAAGTYPEHLVVDRSLTFEGAGEKSTVVDGSGSGTVMMIGSSSASLTIAISGLKIQNGGAVTGAGIASVPGTGMTNQVALTRVVVSHNHAMGAGATGGGIYNGSGGTLTVSRSKVSGNSAGTGDYFSPGAGDGGGIYNAGILTVTDSTISSNKARGGFHSGQPGGYGQGGGIYSAGQLKVSGSTVSANLAQGGNGSGLRLCYRGGDGQGGGLYDASGKGSATLANVTLSGNEAAGGLGGGGRFCFMGGNGGDGRGGGIESSVSEKLLNVTVAGNLTAKGRRGCGHNGCGAPGTTYGGGIENNISIRLTNTILAGNSAKRGPDCFYMVTSGGHNLLGSDSSCNGFTGPGDLVNVDPMLGPLQDNSGPTQTMALMAGSPAIAAADDSACAVPPVKGVDQRGLPRQDDPQCDMGAYEVQP